jgi:hypothetical protein
MEELLHVINKRSMLHNRQPLWSSGQSSSLQMQGSGSIPGATTFSEKQWRWNGVHLVS